MSKTLKSNLHLCFLFLSIAHSNIKYFKKIFRICDILNSPLLSNNESSCAAGFGAHNGNRFLGYKLENRAAVNQP